MRLHKARIQKYRSIRDTGEFEIENGKSILVGPNEAGKSAILKALQQIKRPAGLPGFDPLRDYPRSEYNDITRKIADPAKITVVEARFNLEDSDEAALPQSFKGSKYVFGRRLDNSYWHRIDGGPPDPVLGVLRRDFTRIASHADGHVVAPAVPNFATRFADLSKSWDDTAALPTEVATTLQALLTEMLPHVDEKNADEEGRHKKLTEACGLPAIRIAALATLEGRIPVFVLFSNYFRVRPLIHLEHLAQRIESGVLDDAEYDYGNVCLLKLLGFTARELSTLGKAGDPQRGHAQQLQIYRDQLDKRSYQLNAASVMITTEIRKVWVPNATRGEADKLRLVADGQYLKVVVEDALGVDIELDQRSEGFQWLVSFFVVFFAEASDKHRNAILLLDEPGLHLHGLKQRDFRETITRLAATNQTLYTTHSPFLVGPGELDLVRVVEMPDRTIGTKVHSQVTSKDPGALLPLQEALGYDLAQSLFSQQRNLVLEGLTDYWYLESIAAMFRDAGLVDLNEKIALIPAQSAGKVVYFATILHAHELQVAALLDSDAAGDSAAQQEVLVHTLGNKGILRTKDVYVGPVNHPEVEDLIRETLIAITLSAFGHDVKVVASAQASRPIVDVLADQVPSFSKYKLAKAFIRWARDHTANDLLAPERQHWEKLIGAINKALK